MSRGFNIMLCFIAVYAAAILHSSYAQTTHVVGDALGWVVPPGGPAAYTTWAASKNFRVGDTLVFNFTTGMHTAAEVSKAAYDSCSTANPISVTTTGPASIVLRSGGEHHYICTVGPHCSLGQKLSINVSGASTTSPAPQPAAPVPAPAATPDAVSPVLAPAPAPEAAAPSPSGGSGTYIVGDSLGWTVPTGGSAAYQSWARDKVFRVGDSLVFDFANGRHNVAEVTKAAYDACNTSSVITTITNSPARITLNRPGEHYYLCTFPSHCSLGQKLTINVTAAAMPPSSVALPPSRGGAFGPSGPTNPSTQSPTSPPSGNSASSFAAVLPVTFLSVALAFLY